MPDMTEVQHFALAPKFTDEHRAELARTSYLERAVVFGSRAKGNYRLGSDIDLALFGADLTDADLLSLEGRLDDLILPYQIDLCPVNSLTNQALLEHIQRMGRAIYPNSFPTEKTNTELA
jgi:predicted nucleotidyltransferase